MKIDITEEEREFLERICIRAEMFLKMNPDYSLEKDLNAICNLKMKFKELDSNLINKEMKDDY